MRTLGVDFGDKRTGVAVSDPLGWTAQGLEVVTGDVNKTAVRICELASQYEADTIVVGYPLNMNGSEGSRAGKTDVFIAALKKRVGAETVNIVKWDERLTSAAAARTIRESGGRPTSRKEREKGRLDILSAALILQSYMDRRRIDQKGAIYDE